MNDCAQIHPALTVAFSMLSTLGLSLCLGCGVVSASASAVDVELVLAVDISRSMDAEEFALQRAGYVAAIRHPDFVDAVRAGLHGRIASPISNGQARCAQEIAGAVAGHRQRRDSAEAFAAAAGGPACRSFRGTSISSALTFGARSVRRQCLRRLRARSSTFPATDRTISARRWSPARDAAVVGRHHRQRPADPDPAVVDRSRSRPLLCRMRHRRSGLLRAADQRAVANSPRPSGAS